MPGQVNDVGLKLLVRILQPSGTAVVDLSQATLKQIILLRPDGQRIVATAQFFTDGTDGKIYYNTVEGDLAVNGRYKIQGYVEFGGIELHTSVGKFDVKSNI